MTAGGWVWLAALLASLVSVGAEAAAPEFHRPVHWWKAHHSRYTDESPGGRRYFSVESCLVCHRTVESCNACHEWVGVRQVRGEDDPAVVDDGIVGAKNCTYCHLPGEYEVNPGRGRLDSYPCPGLATLDREMRLIEMHLADLAPAADAAGEISKSYRLIALDYGRIKTEAVREPGGLAADVHRLRGDLYRDVFQPLVRLERDWKAGTAIEMLAGGSLFFAILALLGIWRRRRKRAK